MRVGVLQDDARELNRIAAELAVAEAQTASTPNQLRFVAGAMGPTTRSISVTGGVTFEELAASYQEQADGLIEGGVDLLLLETVQDTINCKAGLYAIERALKATGSEAGIAISGTIETMGTLLSGQDIEAFYTSLAHRGIAGLLHARRGAVDEVLQHVVEEPHDVLDERRMVLPLEPALQVQRR